MTECKIHLPKDIHDLAKYYDFEDNYPEKQKKLLSLLEITENTGEGKHYFGRYPEATLFFLEYHDTADNFFFQAMLRKEDNENYVIVWVDRKNSWIIKKQRKIYTISNCVDRYSKKLLPLKLSDFKFFFQ
jgi:hypothetical protein